MKKYKLLKDLPGIKAGTVFTWTKPNEMNVGYYDARPFGSRFQSVSWLSNDVVERIPEWFELIPDTPKKPYPVQADGKWHFEVDWDGSILHAFTKKPGIPLWNTESDARTFAEDLPLLIGAREAALNRRGWVPKKGELAWSCGDGVNVGARTYDPNDASDVFRFERGDFWPNDGSVLLIRDLIRHLHQPL